MSQGSKLGGIYKYLNHSWQVIDTSLIYWVADYAYSSTGGKCTRNTPPIQATVDPITGNTTVVAIGRKKGRKVSYYSSLFLTEQEATEHYLSEVAGHMARVASYIDGSITGILSKTVGLNAGIQNMQEFADLRATIQKYAQIL